MEKRIIVAALTLLLGAGLFAAGKVIETKVVFKTSVECKNCEKKILDNVAFEKGVRDLSVDLSSKKVTIVFDAAKTDTLKLGNALRRLGFSAKVVE